MGGMIQKNSEFKDSLSIPHFISVTVNKYPGQNNNDNNNNNNNFGGEEGFVSAHRSRLLLSGVEKAR